MPESWAPNIVSFKGYSTDEPDGMKLWSAVQTALADARLAAATAGDRYGEPIAIRPRLGQGAFRVLVTDSYQRSAPSPARRRYPPWKLRTFDPMPRAVSIDCRMAFCCAVTSIVCSMPGT